MDNLDLKIRDYLFKKIENSSEDEKLPSELNIARLFDTTRHKVRNIYDDLEDMGYVYSMQGIGRFAVKKIPEISLVVNGESFTRKMKDENIPLESINLGCRKLTDDEVEKLPVKFSKSIYEIRRLRILYSIPAVIHTSYLSEDRFSNISRDGKEILSISEYYRKNSVGSIKNFGTTLSIKFPCYEETIELKCKSLVPIIELRSIVKEDERDIIEYSVAKYRSDLFSYRL